MKYFVKEGQKIQIAYDKPELVAGDEFKSDDKDQIVRLLEIGVITAIDETKVLGKKAEEPKEEPKAAKEEIKKAKAAKDDK